MGVFSCCFGDGRQAAGDSNVEYARLQPAPLPWEAAAARQQWAPATGGVPLAPAFGEGALRRDDWASSRKLSSAPLQPYHYDVHLSASPPTPPPADALSGRSGSAAAGGGWEAEPAYLREQVAALAAQQAEDRKSGWHLTGRGGGRTRSAATAEPGSSSDDGAAPGVDIFWHSSYEHAAAPKPAKRQDRKLRSPAARRKGGQGEKLLAAAPAFGQGALTKWH